MIRDLQRLLADIERRAEMARPMEGMAHELRRVADELRWAIRRAQAGRD